jgi:hypothetical protein
MPIVRNLMRLIMPGVLLAAVSFTGPAQAHTKSTSDTFSVVSVEVLDASTVDVTFSHQLAAGTTDVSQRHFYGDHLDHDVPHTHEVSSVALVNDSKTARLTFSRALHPEEPACDEPLPKCSDDKIPLIIDKVADTNGNVVSNDDWKIWAIGAKN